MKFCRSTLFEAGTALFMKNWKIYSRKTTIVLTVEAVLEFKEHMADKCIAKPSRSLLQLAILGVYMRRITYDSATVNISVFIEQRNISFQNDISLKTMRLGVLSWEKLKNRETHGRIVSLDQLSLGVWRANADLFVMFIAWTSQEGSKVHKLQSQSWPWC